MRRSLPWLSLLTAILLVCLPLSLHRTESKYSDDERQYHHPAVLQIREHWPALNLKEDSLSATAPGYTWTLAGLSLVTGTDKVSLRLVNLSLSLLFIWMLLRWLPDRAPWDTCLIVAPLAFSNFFIKSASWIVTDNPSLFLSTACLLLLFRTNYGPVSLREPPIRGAQTDGDDMQDTLLLCCAALLACAATFIRQTQCWLAVPLALAAWMGQRPARPVLRLLRFATALTPLCVLGILIRSWGGLVPPIWADASLARGTNHAAPLIYVLSLLGLFGPWVILAKIGRQMPTTHLWGPLFGALGAVALCFIGPLTPSHEAGRWGGYLWNLASMLPSPLGIPLVFLFLAPLGGACLCVLLTSLWTEASTQHALLWTLSLLIWLLTFLPNRQIFQRYFEPQLLVFLILWLCLPARPPKASSTERETQFTGPSRLFRPPLIILALLQLAVTLGTAHRSILGW